MRRGREEGLDAHDLVVDQLAQKRLEVVLAAAQTCIVQARGEQASAGPFLLAPFPPGVADRLLLSALTVAAGLTFSVVMNHPDAALGSWVGARRPFHLSLFLAAPRMVLPNILVLTCDAGDDAPGLLLCKVEAQQVGLRCNVMLTEDLVQRELARAPGFNRSLRRRRGAFS